MKLEDFIKQVVFEIRNGIKEAQKEIPDLYIEIPPYIEFDLAIIVNDKEEIEIAKITDNSQKCSRMKMNIVTSHYPWLKKD